MTYEKVLAVAALCSIMTVCVFLFTQSKFNRVLTARAAGEIYGKPGVSSRIVDVLCSTNQFEAKSSARVS